MSLKISDGCIIRDCSFPVFQERVKNLRPLVRIAVEQQLRKLFKNIQKGDYFDITKAIYKYAPHLFDVSLVFATLRSDILYIPFGHNSYHNLIQTHLNADEYAYMGNIDRPKRYSEEEWDARYSDWLAIVEYGMPYSECMFTANLHVDVPFVPELFKKIMGSKLPTSSKEDFSNQAKDKPHEYNVQKQS